MDEHWTFQRHTHTLILCILLVCLNCSIFLRLIALKLNWIIFHFVSFRRKYVLNLCMYTFAVDGISPSAADGRCIRCESVCTRVNSIQTICLPHGILIWFTLLKRKHKTQKREKEFPILVWTFKMALVSSVFFYSQLMFIWCFCSWNGDEWRAYLGSAYRKNLQSENNFFMLNIKGLSPELASMVTIQCTLYVYLYIQCVREMKKIPSPTLFKWFVSAVYA